MPGDQKEPQSYGEHVNDAASVRSPEHADFHESRRESENSGLDQGRRPVPQWTDSVDVLRPKRGKASIDDSARNVAAAAGGAKREGYFRKRDYE
jgi:hypothetical protein